VVVSSKLETVVRAAHQISLAAGMAIIETAVPRSVTVALALVTGIFRGAASLTVIVPTSASLTCWRLQWSPGNKGWLLSHGNILWSVTAVVLLVEVGAKLFTVVTPAHQVSPAALVPIVSAAVERSVTVSLAQATGLLRSAATSAIVVPSTAPLTCRRLL